MKPQEKDDRDEREDREEKESEESRVTSREPEHFRQGRRESVVWRLRFVQGIATTVLGVLLLALLLLPTASAGEVLTLIGAYWLVSELIAAVSGFSRRADARWAWPLMVGILSTLAGILALAHLISMTSGPLESRILLSLTHFTNRPRSVRIFGIDYGTVIPSHPVYSAL